MILRKPYAFLIKHFRFIHVILSILSIYSLYSTNKVLKFFNSYVSTTINVVGQELNDLYFDLLVYLVPIIIILISILCLWLLFNKKKPIMFYVINVLMYIVIIVVFGIVSNTLSNMELSILNARTIRFSRDLLSACLLFEIVSVIVSVVRATGFDIKKFDFGKDINEIKIEEKDNEEFEFEIKLDKNKVKRKTKRSLRFLRYFYLEHKFILNIFIVLVIGIVVILSFINVKPINVLNEKRVFTNNSITMSIDESYITYKDYKGNVIDKDWYFVIVKLKLKNNLKVKQVLDTATTKLLIGDFKYSHTINYRDEMFDLGSIYQDELLGNEYVYKNLVFKIPKQLVNENMVFEFSDKTSLSSSTNEKDVRVLLKPKNIDIVNKDIIVDLYDVISKYDLSIDSYDVSKYFKLNYSFCSTRCYDSIEYLYPSLGNNDKSILRISGTYNGSFNNVFNLYDFINYFGVLKYEINNEVKTQNIELKEVISTKLVEKDVYYMEVLDEVRNADKIYFVFHIRNQNYIYYLRGEL